MPLTPNFDIYYRDTSTPASLETESALQADSVDDALVAITGNRAIQTFRWANSAARTAQTGMQAGDIGYQIDTYVHYWYNGSSWLPLRNSARPASVAVGSGSSSVATDGTVTFTGASTVSLNGVFDDPTASYEVIVALAHAAAGTVSLRLRTSGTDATSNYSYVYNATTLSTGPTRTSSTSGTSFGFLRSSAAGTNGDLRGRYTVFTPKAASVAAMLEGASAAVYNGDRYHVEEMGMVASGASGFDGISVIASAGTMTGTIKVRNL